MSFSIEQNIKSYLQVYNSGISMSDMHINTCVELSVVIDGKGIHRIYDEATECQTGELYVIDSGVAHDYFAVSEKEYPTVVTVKFNAKELFGEKWINYKSPNFCYGVFRDNSPISYSMLNSNSLNVVKAICNSIQCELSKKDIEWYNAAVSQISLLLITVARYINMADTVTTAHSKKNTVVSAVMHEIFNRFDDSELTLESIANSLYISKSHLSRLFQKDVGESFVDYLRKVRINQACILLKSTVLTNEEIVKKCGLRDIPSFYRIFKKIIGMTPYQYRLSQIKKNKGEFTMNLIEISENLQKGKTKIVKELVENALKDGVSAEKILNEGLLSGMSIIGEKFKKNEVYVPEVLVAARAMNSGVQVLKPFLIDDGVETKGKVCIGTVQGDLHDIGKNLVKLMMEGKGLEVVDLGVDVAPEKFISEAIEHNCQVICCSALLTTTMDVMRDVVKCAEDANIRDKIKIMIGGAPITQEFCDEIGADRYTSDAASAADVAVELCS